MCYMADKEKVPTPPKTPDAKKSPDTPVDKKTEKPKTTKETRDAARVKFEWKKSELGQSRRELEEKRQASDKAGQDLKATNPPETGKKEWVDAEVKKSAEKNASLEKETLVLLWEKHNAEIDDAVKSIEIDKAEPELQAVLHREVLSKTVNIDGVSDADKKKALEGLKWPNGSEIDITHLTPEQKRIVQQYQTFQYLRELAKTSDADIKDPKKLQEIAKKYLGITDFSDKKNTAFLTLDSFKDEVKRDPSVLSTVVESIKDHWFLATGINPKTELGKTLLSITQWNIDEFKKIFPGETDIKKMADFLGGSYIDILGWAPFTWLDSFQDSIKTARDLFKSGELGGISREDFKTDKEFQDALNQAAKKATGLDYTRMASTANKLSRWSGKLSPFVKFLADMIAPIGAMMGGESGEFWREYLKQWNAWKDVAGGGFDGWTSKFEKMKNTTPDALIKSAEKYLGWPYKYGANGSSKETGIDCSQLVVNSLIDEWCLPKWFDTTAMWFAQRSHRLWDTQGKKGDFLIMGEPSPHIALIAEDPVPGSNTYKTIEATSSKWGVVYTKRTAGNSFQVYRNPFFEWTTADLAQNKEWKETFDIKGTSVTITPPLHPKNLSDRNKNPLNIKSTRFPGDNKWHSICPSYEAGITIAVEDLEKKLNGQSEAVRRYTGGRNAQYVRDVIGTWAPESDGNNPNEYTRTVLSRMGFSGDLLKIPVSAVKDRIPELVLQMAKMEWCQATFEFGGH